MGSRRDENMCTVQDHFAAVVTAGPAMAGSSSDVTPVCCGTPASEDVRQSVSQRRHSKPYMNTESETDGQSPRQRDTTINVGDSSNQFHHVARSTPITGHAKFEPPTVVIDPFVQEQAIKEDYSLSDMIKHHTQREASQTENTLKHRDSSMERETEKEREDTEKQHMQTQVSLEVAQCHSVATSPMTPPQGVGIDAFSFPASSKSLEVAQCHSVATSPMTPPQGVGTNAFSFPASSGRTGADTKDVELQLVRQVEFRSVATAPMTPKTPNTAGVTAVFPEPSGRDKVHGREEEAEPVIPQPAITPVLKCSSPRQEQARLSDAFPDSSATSAPQADKPCRNHMGGAEPEQAGDKQRGKQHPAAESFDQEITILVTHHYGYGPEDEEEQEEQGLEVMSRLQSSTTEDAKDSEGLDETVPTGVSTELDDNEWGKVLPPVPQNSLDDGRGDDPAQPQITGADKPSSGRTQQDDSPKTLTKIKPAENKTKDCEGKPDHLEQRSLVDRSGSSSPNQKKKLQHPLVDTPGPASPSKPLQHMQTQVSLEVVQCHSVATSPMTPPQGVGTDAFSFPASSKNLEVAQCHSVATSPMTPPQGVGTDAFSFPASSKNLEVAQCHSVATSPMTPPQGSSASAFPFPASSGRPFTETRDAELQVGQRVECRSVATAPMTPKTPNTSALPATFPGLVATEGEKMKEEVKKAGGATEDSSDEPIQEVRWDEKGMTWEVYGAVVEVGVLGSAIQKHLEKQVKKLRRQPSPTLPPPPPLKPSAVPLRSCSPPSSGPAQGRGSARRRAELEGKRGRRRRNPFRLLLKNVQQPICCSRTHSTE